MPFSNNKFINVRTRFHALMQYAQDTDNARRHRAIENHMHGIADWRFAAFDPAMADVEASYPIRNLGTIKGR